MEGLTLTTREQARIQVLNGVTAGEVTVEVAAGLMGVSERHAWRLLAAYRKEGASAIAHGNRGRKPSTTTDTGTQRRVRELAEGPYAGLNHTHLTELLSEREGIDLSRSMVRRILMAGGVRSPRPRRASRRYSRRERYPQEGMLLQVDGSRHNWLQGRGPYLTLVGAVDDATGKVPAALFRQQEDAQGYLLMLRGIIDHHGVPMALYSDRHGIFQRSSKEPESLAEQLRGRRDPTQFARALKELDIGLVLAHTPQAKGRIERVWGTFQDRLVSEMRLGPESRLSSRPTRFSETFCRASTPGSVCLRHSQARHIANRHPARGLMPSCASSTSAPWQTTTPCGSTAPPCSSCLMSTGQATLALKTRSRSGSTAASWWPTGAEPWQWSRPLQNP